MGNGEVHQQEFGFACYNCGRIILPGEKMLTMSASLEMPNEDGSVQVIESTAIAIVRYSCSSILSRSLDVIVNELSAGDGKVELDVLTRKQDIMKYHITESAIQPVTIAYSRFEVTFRCNVQSGLISTIHLPGRAHTCVAAYLRAYPCGCSW